MHGRPGRESPGGVWVAAPQAMRATAALRTNKGVSSAYPSIRSAPQRGCEPIGRPAAAVAPAPDRQQPTAAPAESAAPRLGPARPADFAAAKLPARSKPQA